MMPLRIETPRLILHADRLPDAEAELRGAAELGQALGAAVPNDWPPELYDRAAIEFTRDYLQANPDGVGWSGWRFLRKGRGGAPPELIGVGGFKGKPGADNTAEVGYSVVASQRRKGYATEVVKGLVAWAFGAAPLSRIVAETLPELAASQKALERNGFVLAGPGSEPGVIRYQLSRAAWEMGRAG